MLAFMMGNHRWPMDSIFVSRNKIIELCHWRKGPYNVVCKTAAIFVQNSCVRQKVWNGTGIFLGIFNMQDSPQKYTQRFLFCVFVF